MTDLAPGSRVGGYHVDELLRSGPRGVVYRATQRALGRSVALHVAPGAPGSAEAERFLAEARRLAALDHVNVLPVYEAGSTDGVAFAATAAVGRPLSELLDGGPLEERRAVEIAAQVAAGLEALEKSDEPVLDPAAILVADETGTPRAYLSPLETPAREDGGSSAVSLARLLETMVGGIERAEGGLAEVLRRAATGAYAGAAEVADAARAAVAPVPSVRRRQRGLIVGVAAAASAAAAAVAFILLVGGGEESSERSQASALAGRVVARIPLGGEPVDLAFAEGAVWVATRDRRVVRVDPRTNRVVGAPIRFSDGQGESQVFVVAGGDAVFAIDGEPGVLVRIDPRRSRVTRRADLGVGLTAAGLDGDVLWVTRTPPRGSELLRVSARSLRPIGRPVPVPPGPADIEVGRTAVYVTGFDYDTVTRVEKRTGRSRSVVVGSGPVRAALHQGVLWVPSVGAGVLTPLDADLRRLPGSVLRPGFPFAAVVLGKDLWVLARPDLSASGGTGVRLYRVDLSTRRLVGRQVPTPPSISGGRPVAGAGSIWLAPGERRELLRVTPTEPPHATRAASPRGRPGVARSGPLNAGRWRGEFRGVRFSFRLDDNRWIAHTPTEEVEFFQLRRFNSLPPAVGIYTPSLAFTKSGGFLPVRSPDQFLSTLRRNPRLNVTPLRPTRLGGTLAQRVEVAVRPHRGYPAFCQRPCVETLGAPGATFVVEAPSVVRFSTLRVRGRTVVITEEPHSAFRLTEPVVHSLRFH